jgi:glucokinase
MILSGDVGGTKTRLALFEAARDSLQLVHVRQYRSADFSSLVEVLAALRRELHVSIGSAAFGIAGPIIDNRSKLTNLGWDVDGREVARFLDLDHVGLLNDLEATAYGTLRLGKEELVVLQEGAAQPERPVAVVAAGTGLGEGALVWDGVRYRAVPSEGGHTEFGARNELEIELLRFLWKRFGRVSYERIVSGPGLVSVYEFFRERSGAPEPDWLGEARRTEDPAAAISQAAIEGTDEACVEALELFVSVYGAEAGNLALKILATGGVFIAGGIAPKILPRLQRGPFLESFHNKGRYRGLMERLPVRVVLNDKTALLGAAHYAVIMNEL